MARRSPVDEVVASMPALSGAARLVSSHPRRIVVFRALMLGDMLCATPALRAIRAAWPHASLTLAGLPWARSWAHRLHCVDDFVAFPGWPGLPEVAPPPASALKVFMGHMRARRFDLAIQLHGSGPLVNAIVTGFGARRNAGFGRLVRRSQPGDRERFTAWPTGGHEIHRLLALTDHLRLPRQGLWLDFPLYAPDRDHARTLLADRRPYAVIHAGSQLPSRRWPPERFAAVADQLARAGLQIVLTGTGLERALVDGVVAGMQHPAVNLCGRTDLWTLAAVLASARVLVSNDTGVSHIAAALRVPSAVVACGSDTARWAPLDTDIHRVLWADVGCRPCAYRVCPIGHACATEVTVEPVVAAAMQACRAGERRLAH